MRTLKRQTFTLPEHLQHPTTPEPRNADEERLWIYFHQLLKQTDPAVIQLDCCPNCGFIFINPRLEQTEIDKKYAWVARLGADRDRHRLPPPRVRQRSQRIFEFIQPLLTRQVLEHPATILDYGGAEGYLLQPFLQEGHRGYLADYMQYAPASPQIEYLGRDLAEIDPEFRFDLILFLHTLEHVGDPVGMLRQLADRLSPGGLLYIEVPLGAWLEWDNLREPITHLNFFSEQSLFFAARAVGLTPVALTTQWQQVVHSHAMPCINLVATRKPMPQVSPVTDYLTTQRQMQPWHQLIGGLRHNPRYYTKVFLKSLAGSGGLR